MHIKRTKHQPSNQRHVSSESFYDEAFKLFSQGFSNQKIEKYNHSGLTIRELLEPSIELVLDEIQGKVTKNVKFQKTTSYFVKRKQFISDIINKRNSKGFNRDEMQFFNEFLKICEYYHQNRSLDEYVYLKLELIFDRIYYSHKKKSKVELVSEREQEQQVDEEDGEEIYSVRPKKREKKRKEEALVVSKPRQDKKVAVAKKKEEKKSIVPVKNEEQPIPVLKVANFTYELQRKKKDLEVLELQHQILLKRSKMLQVQAEINQIQSQINKLPQAINTSIHVPGKNPSLPASNKHNIVSVNKKKESAKAGIRQQIEQQPSQTIISSDSIQPAKVEKQEQQEEEQDQKTEELFKVEAEDDDQSQYLVQRQTRKRSIVKSKSKKKKRSKQQKRGSHISIQAKNKAPTILKKIDPNFLKANSHPPQALNQPLKPAKAQKIKSRSKRQQKIIVPRQDYYSRHWTSQQQKFLISHLQNINSVGLPTIQSKLTKQFGKKDRFRVTSIKDKKIEMFKICRKRFLNELQKRQLMSQEQFGNVAEHLHCLDNRASFDFVSQFLQNYYFSEIDTMLNKAFKDTYSTILKLKIRPKKYNTDSCDWQENTENIGQSQSYFPSRQESHTDTAAKPILKREINRLGITEDDIVETRKTINFNKKVKQLAVVKEQINSVKQIDTYFEEDMEEEQAKVKEEVGNEEVKATKTGANLKSAFQKYKQEVIDKQSC